MHRIAGMTVLVKAEGIPEAIYNGQRDKVVEAVKAEMARQKAALNAQMDSMQKEMAEEIAIERERADIQQRGRSRFQKERLGEIRASMLEHASPAQKALRAAENAWAMAYAMVRCWKEILAI